jgi:hypothetical protein
MPVVAPFHQVKIVFRTDKDRFLGTGSAGTIGAGPHLVQHALDHDILGIAPPRPQHLLACF